MRAVTVAALACLIAAPGFAKDAGPGRPGLPEVTAAFEAVYSEACFSVFELGADSGPQAHTFTFRYDFDDGDTNVREATLYSFFCFTGAYNQVYVYFLVNDFDEIEPVAFAEPHYDVRYADGDFDGPVEGIDVLGWTARAQLVNPEFDPEEGTLTSHSLWRGMGDAFSQGVWRFHQGGFVLESYDVDASYDGEINPERLYGPEG